jgi:hypothetical protein
VGGRRWSRGMGWRLMFRGAVRKGFDDGTNFVPHGFTRDGKGS